jgi:hypothetical protein
MPFVMPSSTDAAGKVPSRSTWEIISDLLDRPGQAARGAIRAGYTQKNPLAEGWAGFSGQKKVYGTDLLNDLGLKPGIGRSVAGFGVDVVTDPLTYFGGTLGKGAIKLGSKGFGLLGKGVEAAATVSPKVAQLSEIAKSTKDAIGRTFSTVYGLVPEYKTSARLTSSALRRGEADAADEVIKVAKGFSPETRRRALVALEMPGQPMPIEVETLVTRLRPLLSDAYDLESRLGLQDPLKKITDYAPRVFKGTGQEGFGSNLGRNISAKLGFSKKRELPDIFTALKRGAEPDAAVATFNRLAASKRATTSAQHIIDTAQKFGVDGVRSPKGRLTNIPEGMGSIFSTKATHNLAEKSFFDQTIKLADGTAIKLRDVVLPKNIVENLNSYYMRSGKDAVLPAWMGATLTGINQTFRKGATVWRPAFHGTNLQGNVFNMGLAGMDPISSLVGTAKQGLKLAKGDITQQAAGQLSGPEVAAAIQKYNISNPISTWAGEFGTGRDMMRMLDGGVKEGLLRKAGAGYERFMRKMGTSIEGGSKETLFRNALQRGSTAEEAAALVNKHLFDYGDLTNAEMNIRKAIPFYTWMRKNLPLQAEMLVKKPTIYAGLGKMKQVLEDPMKSREGGKHFFAEKDRPEYMREGGTVQVGGDKKGARMWTPYLPYQDLNMLPTPGKGVMPFAQQVLSMLGPTAKIPLEAVLNKNFLTQRPLYDADLGYVQNMQGNVMGMPVPPVAQHLFQNMNPALPYMAKSAQNILEGENIPAFLMQMAGIRVPKKSAEWLATQKKYARSDQKTFERRNVVAARKTSARAEAIARSLGLD